MSQKPALRVAGLVILLGGAWGLGEALLGLGLKSCARSISGSVMTAVAFFFLAAGVSLGRRFAAVGALVLLAVTFKLFDGLLLSLPLGSGAVANPIIAIVLEGSVILALVSGAGQWTQTPAGRVGLGAAAGLASAALFPLAGLITGSPACLLPGTALPLAWAFAPLTAGLTALTLPLGYALGAKLDHSRQRLSILAPASLSLCLAIMALLRIWRA